MTMAISRSRNRQVLSSAEDLAEGLAEDVAEAVTTEGVGVPDPPGAAVMIHPPNTLRQKVCGAGPAEQAPAAAAPQPAMMQAVADCVDDLYRVLMAAQAEPGAAPAALAQVRRCADRLAAVGAAHRHRLVERIAALLTRTASHLQTIDAAAMPLIKAHADALRAVIHDRPDGDAGTVGDDLIACLTVLAEKAESERP